MLLPFAGNPTSKRTFTSPDFSSKPMKQAVAFRSPDSMRVSMKLPHKGEITGMGIRAGITLIVGGGYHGKSTLLKALEMGVYPHISGDGREYVVTEGEAVISFGS